MGHATNGRDARATNSLSPINYRASFNLTIKIFSRKRGEVTRESNASRNADPYKQYSYNTAATNMSTFPAVQMSELRQKSNSKVLNTHSKLAHYLHSHVVLFPISRNVAEEPTWAFGGLRVIRAASSARLRHSDEPECEEGKHEVCARLAANSVRPRMNRFNLDNADFHWVGISTTPPDEMVLVALGIGRSELEDFCVAPDLERMRLLPCGRYVEFSCSCVLRGHGPALWLRDEEGGSDAGGLGRVKLGKAILVREGGEDAGV